ncbi:hypothetical protein T484DRAFT_1834616, partial [Baffinella frigidus]
GAFSLFLLATSTPRLASALATRASTLVNGHAGPPRDKEDALKRRARQAVVMRALRTGVTMLGMMFIRYRSESRRIASEKRGMEEWEAEGAEKRGMEEWGAEGEVEGADIGEGGDGKDLLAANFAA